MQIVAHPDDDFLFMNPDLQQQISAGFGIVTVYVTAGEAGGAGQCPVEVARAEHAHARQRAVRAAYARMAHPEISAEEADRAPWRRELIVPDAGVAWPHTVERYTLPSYPSIRLIFMNLREDGDVDAVTPGDMFADPTLRSNTLVPSCTSSRDEVCDWIPCKPEIPEQNYTKAELLHVLSKLVEMYQPVVIRTLDPQPFERVGSGANVCPGGGRYDVCFDNLDHRAVARYVDAVLAGYHGPNGTGRHTVVHYKGYSFINYPRNVGTENYTSKRAAGEAYEHSKPGDPYYHHEIYDPYYAAMYERYPGSTQWLELAADGRLVAVNVEDRQVKLWHENEPKGAWSGPIDLGGGAPIAPHLTLLKRPDGLLQIFATRLPLGMEQEPTPVPPPQEVITAIQNGSAMSFGEWQSLGAPDTGRFTGVATAAIDGSGRTFAFARNSAGLLAYTFLDGGSWSTWAPVDPEAEDIMDGIAAIRRDDGVLEVFATSRTGRLQRYVQSGTAFQASGPAVFDFRDAASPPTVTKNQDGRLELFYRESTDKGYGRVLTVWVTTSGQWAGPTVLFGDAGVGPIAAIRRAGTGHIMLFQRNAWGGISTTHQKAPNDVFYLQWNLRSGSASGYKFLEYPAAATDGLGRVVFIAKYPDGRLFYQRESAAGAVGSFGGFVPAGN